MAFPTSPTNGQQANINGITYTYSSAATAWTVSTSVSNTFVSINVSDNVNSGNVLATGVISATGNVSGGNLVVTGNIVDTGALTIVTGSNGNITLSPDGTGIVTATGAISTTGNISANNATFTSNQTLSYGTANGVIYLNSNKVATSGTALTWDGSTLAVNGTLSTTGDATVGSAGGTRTLTIGNTASTGAGFINLVTSSAFKNWQIASNQYVASALSFTPSTATGGTTFTTPTLNILDNSIAVTGRISVSGTNPSIQQTVQNSYLDLCGGTTVGTDPSIQIAGSTTVSDANSIFYNANTHVVRTSSGGTTISKFNQYGIGLSTATPSSGVGITFPATQNASSNANTLDDYEEGTWTPVLTDGTNNVSSYYYQYGSYIKVGRMVTINCTISVFNKGSITGSVYITGLPFTSGVINSVFEQNILAAKVFALGSNNYAVGVIDTSSTIIGAYLIFNGGQGSVQASNISGGTQLFYSGTYWAAA